MKVLHGYCNGQHRSAVLPVLEELRKRGHEVKEVQILSKTLDVAPGQEDISSFNQDVFINSYPHIMKSGELRFAFQDGLKVCVEHGVNPIAWAFPLDRHSLYDLVCLAGPWQQGAVQRSGMQEDLKGKCVVTGWPKVDALVEGRRIPRAEARANLEKKMRQPFVPDQPVIAFVPTHGGAWWRMDQMLPLKIPNLVVAPHEGRYRSFRQEPGALRYMAINYAAQYPWYIETPDIYEVLCAADLVISDYSSAMLEALVLDVPIVQLLTDMKLHNRPGSNPLRDGFYRLSQHDNRTFMVGPNVNRIETLTDEIGKLLSDPTYYARERRFWKDEIFFDLGHATHNVCAAIENRVLSR